MLYVLIILGLVFVGVSIYFSVQSDDCKRYDYDAGYKKYKLLSGISMGLAVCLIAGTGIAFLASNTDTNFDSSYNSKRDDFGNDETEAWVAAQLIVEKQLKSPSTAKFCRKGEATIVRDGNSWTVTGYVDAQNSFGATLRNEFAVQITFTSSNKYKINYCRIN